MKGPIPKSALLCFLLAGVLGLTVFIFLYNDAFPEASLDMKLTRGEVVAKSGDFLRERGFRLAGYRTVAVFTEQRKQIDFLERHLGLRVANDLFRRTVSVWRWSVRWFKELEEVEYTVEYTPDGRLAGFTREIPKSAPGARLEEKDARAIAETFLSKELALNLSRYAYIERVMMDCPHRLDQDLVWRSRDWSGVGGSEHRIAVRIQGDKVGGFSERLKIPQSWTVAQQNIDAKRDLLAQASYLPILLLYLAMAVVFFWRAHAGDIRWRWSFVIAGLSAVIVLLEQMNKLPFSLLSYDTTQSLNVFWLKYLSVPFLAAIAGFVLFIPLFAATDSMGRLCLPERSWVSNVFSRTYLSSPDAGRQVFLGYAMAFAAIGYVTLFYALGQRFIGVWSPVEVKFSNSFSTYFPALTAIYTGFSAAFTEELTFRLFAIALLYKITRRMWPAVIIPAFIWGFAHSTYPQEPIWIRGLELTAAGLVYGWVFLRFGLITTLVSHFIYNVFVGIVPQLQSGRPGLVANGVIALALPLVALFFARRLISSAPWKRLRARVARPRDEAPPAPVAHAGPPTAVCGVETFSWKRLVLFVMAGGLVYGLSFLTPTWDFYGKAPPVKLTRQEAAALCEKALTDSGVDATGYRSYTVFRDRTESLPSYVISRFGIPDALSRFRAYYGFQPEWVRRWYKEKTVQITEVSVDDKGRLLTLRRRLAETDPGARLTEDDAKRIAGTFLLAAKPGATGEWDCIEADRIDRPNRLDYDLTYRDRRFTAGDLQRKLSVTVSGDKVTSFGRPWYEVPEDWERKREVLQKGLRNSVRKLAAAFLGVGFFIFFVVQVVILFRRKVARREDVTHALYWGLALGAIPAFLEALNALPSFYHEYFYETAQPLTTYTLTGLLSFVMEVIWMPVAVFFLVFLARMIFRAWIPERGDLSSLLDPLRPSRFGSRSIRQGLILGLAAAAFSSGLDRLMAALKTWLAPDLFTPHAATTNIDISRLSELLDLAGKVPQLITGCFLLLIMVAFVRRFLRKDAVILAVLAFGMFLFADITGVSWRNVAIEWSLETAGLIIVYYLVTRAIRWNVPAYLVWLWIELNVEAVTNFRRFAFSHSPEFFWPSVEQMAVLVLPIAAALIYAFVKKEESGARTPASPEEKGTPSTTA